MAMVEGSLLNVYVNNILDMILIAGVINTIYHR